MKKKIYDGPKLPGFDFVIPRDVGCEPINQHFHSAHNFQSSRQVNYYHINGVTVMYASSTNYDDFLHQSHRATIWLYGAEKAVAELEQKITAEIEKVKHPK